MRTRRAARQEPYSVYEALARPIVARRSRHVSTIDRAASTQSATMAARRWAFDETEDLREEAAAVMSVLAGEGLLRAPAPAAEGSRGVI